MTDILERAKAADIDLMASTDWGQLRNLFRELIAEVEAKQANNEYLQKMTEEAQGIMQESQLLLCKEANEAEQLQNEVERLRSLENCVSLVIDRQGKTNAALLGQLDVISAYLDAELVEWKNGDQIAEIAIKFMDLQKQKLNDANSQIAAKDARIDLLDSDQKRYHAAWMAAEEDKEEQAARIKELEARIGREQVATMQNREAQLQNVISSREAYIKLLEAAFLKAKATLLFHQAYELGGFSPYITSEQENAFEEKAREALERIKEGGKDEN